MSSTNNSERSRKVYRIITEHFGGDRVEALELWVKLYTQSNPIDCLGEDKELVEIVLKGYDRYSNLLYSQEKHN